MKNVGIISLGHYLPARRLTNADLEKMVDTTDEWIVTRTGIKERRIAELDERTSNLAINAAKEAIKNAKLKPEQIGLIIVATISPDRAMAAVIAPRRVQPLSTRWPIASEVNDPASAPA